VCLLHYDCFITAKRLFAPRSAANTKKLDSAVVVLKPNAYSHAAVARILEILEGHEIKVTSRGMLPSVPKERAKVIATYLAPVGKCAELLAPSELTLKAEDQAQFRNVFGCSWTDALSDDRVVNAKTAAQRLQLAESDHSTLGNLWRRAKRLRIAEGVYCARSDASSTENAALREALTQSPLYVINGFYTELVQGYATNTTYPMYLCVEWDTSVLTWSDMEEHIIGDPDPIRALRGSIRGTLYREWEELGLSEAPTREKNAVHFSHSAFEAMAERLVLCKGAILFTDALGAKLLAHNVPALAIQNWLTNPVVCDKAIFESMRSKNAEECVALAPSLLGAHPAFFHHPVHCTYQTCAVPDLQRSQARSACSYRRCSKPKPTSPAVSCRLLHDSAMNS
jgi:nucleoside diphosphate kinase